MAVRGGGPHGDGQAPRGGDGANLGGGPSRTADRVIPYAGLDRLRPDAVAETLPRTGHIAQIERAAAFERILAAVGAH